MSAVRCGRSLLPVGVLSISGDFERGDLIQIEDSTGLILGHGLSYYSSKEATRICGLQSTEIPSRLGYQGHEELVHADHLVIRAAHKLNLSADLERALSARQRSGAAQ